MFRYKYLLVNFLSLFSNLCFLINYHTDRYVVQITNQIHSTIFVDKSCYLLILAYNGKTIILILILSTIICECSSTQLEVTNKYIHVYVYMWVLKIDCRMFLHVNVYTFFFLYVQFLLLVFEQSLCVYSLYEDIKCMFYHR